MSPVLWGRSVLGCQKVPRKVPPRFHQRSTKIPPRFQRGSPSFVVSLLLRGRSFLGCQKVPRKVPPRFHQRSTKIPPRFQRGSPSFVVSLLLWGRSVLGCQKVPRKVPPRFHEGCASFVISLVSWGRSLLFPKRLCGGFRDHFFTFVSQFLQFFHFSPTVLALGPSAIAKVLGQNDTFVFWGSLQQMVFASQKVLWSVPQTVRYIRLRVPRGF